MKSKLIYFVIYNILIQGLIACANTSTITPIIATTAPEFVSPDEIVQEFYQAMNDGDIETAISFAADDIDCRGHCYITGKDSFQTFIEVNIDHHDRFEISELRIDGNKVIFNYVIYRENSVLVRGIDSVMQIQDGKIIYFEIN
jgi:limonene-1,2-epoxide hydrolase